MNHRRGLLKWILLPVFWCVLIAALLEVTLRVAVPVLPPRLAATARLVMTGQPYLEGWEPVWQYDNDHYYIVRPDLDNVLQYAGPNTYFHVSTISLWGGRVGFRTRPVDYRVDAVAVGDSYTFCFTEIADCWLTLLEQRTGLGIVNLGQPVTGTTSHLRILATFGGPLEPPLVLWQFVGNDFNDDYGLAVLRGEITEIPEDPATLPQPPELPPSPPVAAWLQHNSVLYSILEVLFTGRWGGLGEQERIYIDPYRVTYRDGTLEFGRYIERMVLDMSRERNQVGMALSRQAFAEAQDLVAGWGGRLAVILIPVREHVYAHLTTPILGEETARAFASSYEAMLQMCGELGLTCLDTLPALQEHARQGEHLYYTDDPHLNPHGNAVLAEIVQTWLEENRLLPES